MRWILSLIGALLVVSATVFGIRHAMVPPVAPFIVPGATNIQVIALGPGTRLITYQAPGPRCAWYATVTRNLAVQHWKVWSTEGQSMSDPETAAMPPYRPRRSHMHLVAFPLGDLWEVAVPLAYLWDVAVLDPNPNVAWPEASAPFHCRRATAELARGEASEPEVARIVVRRAVLPSSWLEERKHRLVGWLHRLTPAFRKTVR